MVTKFSSTSSVNATDYDTLHQRDTEEEEEELEEVVIVDPVGGLSIASAITQAENAEQEHSVSNTHYSSGTLHPISAVRASKKLSPYVTQLQSDSNEDSDDSTSSGVQNVGLTTNKPVAFHHRKSSSRSSQTVNYSATSDTTKTENNTSNHHLSSNGIQITTTASSTPSNGTFSSPQNDTTVVKSSERRKANRLQSLFGKLFCCIAPNTNPRRLDKLALQGETPMYTSTLPQSSQVEVDASLASTLITQVAPPSSSGTPKSPQGQQAGTPTTTVATSPTVQIHYHYHIHKHFNNPPPNGVKYLLPEQQSHIQGRKTLVLDLDETLVHSSFKPVPRADFVIQVEIENVLHKVYVMKRPGVETFLREVGKYYEVVIFTASLSKYADPVVDRIDTYGVVHHRLFREHCTFRGGNYVKDLSRLGRDLSQVIIVDNSPVCYSLQPQNAMPTTSWFDSSNCTELLEFIPWLERIAMDKNVLQGLEEFRSVFQFQ